MNVASQPSATPKRVDLNFRIGLIVKRLRCSKNIKQVDFAKTVGLTQPQLSMFENGKANQRLNLNQLKEMALMVGLESLSELIELVEKERNSKGVIERLSKLHEGF